MPRNAAQRRTVAACLNELWAMDEMKLDQIRGFLELRASGIEIPEADITAAMDQRARSPIVAFDEDNQKPLQQDNGRFIVDGVEVLSLFGTLSARMNMMARFSGGTSTQQFGQAFDRAMRDNEIQTIFIEVDSPGGTVAGTDELAAKIFAARGKKRVVAVARGMVASAAYYIASAAEVFAATPSTEGGSIGVYAITRESTERNALEGDRYYVWRAGTLKAAGNEYEEVSKEQGAALQARVDAPYQMFLKAVATHRSTDVATVSKDFGQGTVFVASEMLRRNMIDRVDSIEKIFDEERQRAAASKPSPQSSSFAQARATLDSLVAFADSLSAVEAASMGATSGSSSSADLVARANELSAVEITAGQASSGTPLALDSRPSTLNSTPTKPPVTKLETSTMNPRIKAALFAQGLIASMEASDEVCQAALSGYFRGNVPKADDDTLKALNGQGESGERKAESGQKPAGNTQAAHDREFEEARQAAELSGAQRVLELQSRAALLSKTGFVITAEQVKDAIEKNWSVAQSVDAWTSVAASDKEPPVRVGVVAAEGDKFVAAASDALLLQCMPTTDRSTLAAGATQLASLRTIDIVKRDMQNRGLAIRGGDEDVASAWLKSLGEFSPVASASAATAADYPNLLAGFVDKRLAAAMRLQASKYRLWCGQEPSVADLNPRLVIGQSDFGRLDDLEGDDAELPQDRTTEKALAWFKVMRKGKSTALTPVMITQDQLGAFANRYAKLVMAVDRTINDMAVDLLVANPTMIDDSVALFHATHGTTVASGAGGVPSAAQAKLMRLRMRTQVGIDTTDPIEAEPFAVLVPATLEDDAKQTYYKYERLNEVKTPVTDATLNVHRGTAEVITEGRLDSYSTAKWYAFADPMLWPVIKYVFQQGYENGKRRSWYEASRDTTYFGIESRVAVFAAGWRGAVENFGS